MTLSNKLELISQQALAGKKAIADALISVGITAVEPNPNRPDSYEIFQSYADKIKRLMISNSLIFEFNANFEENATKYKRTLMLPMAIRLSSNNNPKIDELAIDIVNSDTGYTNSSNTKISQYAVNQSYNGGGGKICH